MNSAFDLASQQLRDIANASDGTLQVHDEGTPQDGLQLFRASIGFDGRRCAEGGLRVRAREPFIIAVPSTFPFHRPYIATPHTRFAGFPHVQWRRHLCLYGSQNEWRPEDGMYGLIKRLDAWVRDAALNNLDPDDAPLHPPVAYATVDRLFVPRADTPRVVSSPWFGHAELREKSNHTEIVRWVQGSGEHSAESALAILLHQSFPFEYPATVRALLDELERNGIDYVPFLFHLGSFAQHSSPGTPLHVVLGTPMRRVTPGGPALQHLAIWEIAACDTDKLRALDAATRPSESSQRDKAIGAVVEWSASAKVGWCHVAEMRPEVTRRRDDSSPMSWFLGKKVAILGCGAVGSHVAESAVRAGTRSLTLVDDKGVSPGLLVRQGFEYDDIGRSKALALAERLKRIDPELETAVSARDVIAQVNDDDLLSEMDLILDCTASLAVRTAFEHSVGDSARRQPIASIAVDSQAATAMATLSKPSHSGGTLDLVRRLKLEACRRSDLLPLLEAFWPVHQPGFRFQPEPGCSEPTFVGSNADLAGLSARMLNSIARALKSSDAPYTGAAWLCHESGPIHKFAWSPDHTLRESGSGYSVRVSSLAAREMRAWAKRCARTAGAGVETGGLLFGELNEAARVLWVTEVDGPPPDSQGDADHFTCGTEGTKEAAEERESRFRGSVNCVGTWHTHPTSAPLPSCVDFSAVAQLLAEPNTARRTCLLLILSGNPDEALLGAHVFRTELPSQPIVHIKHSVAAVAPLAPVPHETRNVGLALSGGGSRAIAFHLGCLRALQDLDLLQRAQVISSVSGGSVISAMYAYSNCSFEEFDTRVVQLLRRGLERDIIADTLTPDAISKSLRGLVITGFYSLARLLRRLREKPTKSASTSPREPPPARLFSRTEAFRNVLAKSLYGETLMHEVTRGSFHTVINATELRTGSAFRFGSKESGCWRLGTIAPREAPVADAVAASAAYPIVLPALEREYAFRKDHHTTESQRAVLTDGGVLENLGVSPLEPGRISSVSTNVFNPDYIISCDAGTGIPEGQRYPSRWLSRVGTSFRLGFRKVQDATRNRLHSFQRHGEISGFVLAYLGQQDCRLPWIPPGLPQREEVRNYPTNFRAMSRRDLDRLALRGELLTRSLVAYYLPDL